MIERQARGLEVRGSNPGQGSNFSLEFKKVLNNENEVPDEYV